MRTTLPSTRIPTISGRNAPRKSGRSARDNETEDSNSTTTLERLRRIIFPQKLRQTEQSLGPFGDRCEKSFESKLVVDNEESSSASWPSKVEQFHLETASQHQGLKTSSDQEHQPPADKHQPSADKHQPPADKHQPPADKHQPPEDKTHQSSSDQDTNLGGRLPMGQGHSQQLVAPEQLQGFETATLKESKSISRPVSECTTEHDEPKDQLHEIQGNLQITEQFKEDIEILQTQVIATTLQNNIGLYFQTKISVTEFAQLSQNVLSQEGHIEELLRSNSGNDKPLVSDPPSPIQKHFHRCHSSTRTNQPVYSATVGQKNDVADGLSNSPAEVKATNSKDHAVLTTNNTKSSPTSPNDPPRRRKRISHYQTSIPTSKAPMTPVGGGNGRGAGETTAGSPIQDPPPRQSTVADGEHPPGGKRRRMRHFLYRILTRLGVHTVLHSDAPAPTRLEGVEEKSVPEEDEATLQIRWVNPRWKQGYRSDAGQDSVSCPISNSHKTTYWTRKNADEPISAQGRQRESTNQRARRNHFYMRPVNWKPGSKQLEIPALRKYPLRGFDQLLQTSPQGHQPSSPADKPPTPGMGQLLQTSPVNHLEQTLLRKKQPPMPTDKHQPLETVRREHLLMAMDKHLQTSPKDQPLQTAQKDQPLWTTQKDKPLHTPQNNQTMLQTLPQKDQLPQTLRKEHLLMPTNKPLQTPQKDQLQQTLLPCTDDGIQALQPTLEQPSQEPRTSHHTTVLLNALTNKIQTLSNSWGKRVALLTEHQTS